MGPCEQRKGDNVKVTGMDVRRGSIRRGFVETAGYADGIRLRIPVIVAAGIKAGKTLAVVAGQHGRELNGPAAIYKVIQSLRPRQMCGKILFFPAVNHLSMRQHVQDFPTERGRNLAGQPPNEPFNVNRNWPGNRRGSLQQRITAAVWNAGVKKADAVIDLHAWTDRHIGLAWTVKDSLPYLRAFGFPWSEVASEPAAAGMLESACLEAKIPSLTCELTPQDVVNGESVRYGIHGILNVARFMGIVAGDMEFPWPRYELARGADVSVVSEAPGLVVTTRKIGEVIEAGEPAVDLVDLESFRAVQVAAPPERMVLRGCGRTWGTGMLGYHVVQAGETIAVFSKIDREWAEGEEPW